MATVLNVDHVVRVPSSGIMGPCLLGKSDSRALGSSVKLTHRKPMKGSRIRTERFRVESYSCFLLVRGRRLGLQSKQSDVGFSSHDVPMLGG